MSRHNIGAGLVIVLNLKIKNQQFTICKLDRDIGSLIVKIYKSRISMLQNLVSFKKWNMESKNLWSINIHGFTKNRLGARISSMIQKMPVGQNLS